MLALVHEWSNSDDLDRYLNSEDSRKYLALMELASQQPEIWFDTVATREGLERLAAALGGVLITSRMMQ